MEVSNESALFLDNANDDRENRSEWTNPCADRLLLARLCHRVGAERVRSAPVVQTSTCSAIVKASSTSIQRYRTVLSILVWPSRS
jgi:hypothetical protein